MAIVESGPVKLVLVLEPDELKELIKNIPKEPKEPEKPS